MQGCAAGDDARPPQDPVNDPVSDTGDDTPEDTPEDTGIGGWTVELLVAALREDTSAAILENSAAGWPLAVTGGYLFVTAEPGEWMLAGDFNGWIGAPMTEEAGFSWAVAAVPEASGYKFTNGTDWLADPWSRQYTHDAFGEMSLVNTTGGHLERLFAVGDVSVAARTLRAWVPAEPATHVLYVADGQNLFDPEAAWGGWALQLSVPAAMLVVGVDNTAARMDEYTPVEDILDGTVYGGDGDVYAAFVQETVRPLAARTWGEPAQVGVMGSSLGGLISFHIADRYPGEYAFAASLSGTMGWGSIGADNETMIARYAAAGHRDTALYVDSGGNGAGCADSDGDGTHDDDAGSSDNYCENLQLRDVLSANGYEFDVDLWHWWEPDAPHNEAAWGGRAWRPLAIFAEL